jgi:DNA-directed RNA polymerase subunit RPC12/RpoP
MNKTELISKINELVRKYGDREYIVLPIKIKSRQCPICDKRLKPDTYSNLECEHCGIKRMAMDGKPSDEWWLNPQVYC